MSERNENRLGYKKTMVGWIPEEWSVHQIGQGCRIKHGYAFSGHVTDQDSEDAPIVICIGNYSYSGGFRFGSTPLKRIKETYPSEYVLQPGDIVLAMTCQTPGGEILGLPGIVPDDGITYLHNQRLGLLEIEKMTFNLRLFLKSEIEIPSSIEEQRRIIRVLSCADEETKKLTKKLTALEEQKRGLMQKLLTGEVRVRVDAQEKERKNQPRNTRNTRTQ